MGFKESFISGLGSSAASTGIGFLGSALSQAFGLSWSSQKAMQEQWKYNKNIMALQNQYRQQAAAQSQQYAKAYRDWETDRKSTRLNSSHITRSRMPSSA